MIRLGPWPAGVSTEELQAEVGAAASALVERHRPAAVSLVIQVEDGQPPTVRRPSAGELTAEDRRTLRLSAFDVCWDEAVYHGDDDEPFGDVIRRMRWAAECAATPTARHDARAWLATYRRLGGT